ncbi:hypothetical protein [Actinocorallia longicatena]|uniref:WD40 repeat protein n=1 Tax=Actinocorallia longicatena TaxID=111803 RepID=A0ABP6QIG6_9ACTN
MTDLERRLAQALGEAADLVPERPPGALPAVRRRFSLPLGLAPLAAALCVLLVLAAFGWYTKAKSHEVLRIPAGAPGFYADVRSVSEDMDRTVLEIRNTRTGAVTDSRDPARPGTMFSGLTGRGDGRSFIVTEERQTEDCEAISFSRVSVSAEGRITELVPVAEGLGAGNWLGTSPTAWSRDGRWLAVALQTCEEDRGRIVLHDLERDVTVEYRGETGGVVDLAWGPDGALYFVGAREEEELALWKLGTGTGDLFQASTRLPVTGGKDRSLGQVVIDPDGTSVVAVMEPRITSVLCRSSSSSEDGTPPPESGSGAGEPEGEGCGEADGNGPTGTPRDVERISLDGRFVKRLLHEENIEPPSQLAGDASGRNFLLETGVVEGAEFIKRNERLPYGLIGLEW